MTLLRQKRGITTKCARVAEEEKGSRRKRGQDSFLLPAAMAVRREVTDARRVAIVKIAA